MKRRRLVGVALFTSLLVATNEVSANPCVAGIAPAGRAQSGTGPEDLACAKAARGAGVPASDALGGVQPPSQCFGEPRRSSKSGGGGSPPSKKDERDPDEEYYGPGAAQPDFTLVNLPTALRLPRFRSTFRVTHRFARPLGAGDFGDLVENLFGIDAGAIIGLEYRFSLVRRTQIGFHRTTDKTIELFAEGAVLGQSDRMPVGLTAWASIEGTNNLGDNHSPSLGAIVSRTFGRRGAIYAEPIWVNNTNSLPSELVDDNSTMIVGLGARLRIRPTVYLVAEVTPRIAGYDPGAPLASFAIEKQVGGHVFQVNFSNGFGTTMANIARGGFNADDWYLGFNISRKFL